MLSEGTSALGEVPSCQPEQLKPESCPKVELQKHSPEAAKAQGDARSRLLYEDRKCPEEHIHGD